VLKKKKKNQENVPEKLGLLLWVYVFFIDSKTHNKK